MHTEHRHLEPFKDWIKFLNWKQTNPSWNGMDGVPQCTIHTYILLTVEHLI